MKGIILAGGKGTRLAPLTMALSKQILPVYNKPMIYYPLSTLMQASIRDILIISTPEHLGFYQSLFGDGSRLGLSISYREQPEANGLAQAFVIGEDFIGADPVALVLGDNIFYGTDFYGFLDKFDGKPDGGLIFGYRVADPERYGVVEFDQNDNVISIEEKPTHPKSHYAVPGLYFYDNSVVAISKELKPSPRGEYEITDVNNEYLRRGKLKVALINRGNAWLDTGTHRSLLEASSFVQTIEDRKGQMISCLEEIALQKGFIDSDKFKSAMSFYPSGNEYHDYLKIVLVEYLEKTPKRAHP